MSSSLVGGYPKREGRCAIRSTNGLPVLDETYSYIVRCTNRDESYTTVLTTPGLPLIGDPSPSGFGTLRAKNAVRRESNPIIWDVVCDYSSEVQESSTVQDPTRDPTIWVPIYETKYEKIQEVVTKDKAGTVIANSAGQPFPVGLTQTRKIPVWEFYQIEAPVSDETIVDRSETVNSVAFKGRVAKSLLLTVLSSQVGFYYGARRRLTHYSLKYNKKLWTHKRADVGTVYLSGGVQLPYLDGGTPARVINGGLNGSGAKVSVGSPPAERSFDMYDELDFRAFLRI